jgi:hypothetical protein
MKKIFVAASMALLTGITAAAAPLPAHIITRKEYKQERKEWRMAKKVEQLTEPTYQTAEQFAIDFPDARNVRWSRDEYEKATFTNADGKEMNAYYDYSDQLIGTITQVDYATLPETAHKQIAKEYKDYTVGPVLLFDDNEDNDAAMALYALPFQDRDNYFAELKKDDKRIVVQITMEGDVFFFKDL